MLPIPDWTVRWETDGEQHEAKVPYPLLLDWEDAHDRPWGQMLYIVRDRTGAAVGLSMADRDAVWLAWKLSGDELATEASFRSRLTARPEVVFGGEDPSDLLEEARETTDASEEASPS